MTEEQLKEARIAAYSLREKIVWSDHYGVNASDPVSIEIRLLIESILPIVDKYAGVYE